MTEEIWNERAERLYDEVIHKYKQHKVPSHIVNEIATLYNHRFNAKAVVTSCPACLKNLWKRLKIEIESTVLSTKILDMEQVIRDIIKENPGVCYGSLIAEIQKRTGQKLTPPGEKVAAKIWKESKNELADIKRISFIDEKGNEIELYNANTEETEEQVTVEKQPEKPKRKPRNKVIKNGK